MWYIRELTDGMMPSHNSALIGLISTQIRLAAIRNMCIAILYDAITLKSDKI